MTLTTDRLNALAEESPASSGGKPAISVIKPSFRNSFRTPLSSGLALHENSDNEHEADELDLDGAFEQQILVESGRELPETDKGNNSKFEYSKSWSTVTQGNDDHVEEQHKIELEEKVVDRLSV